MLPSMPLISNISKDIVECASMSAKLPKVVLSMESVNRSTQTKRSGDILSLPSLSSPSNKKASPLKRVTPILKKYNSHRKGKGGKSVTTAVKGNEAVQGKPAPRTIAPKPLVVIVPSEEINFQESSTTENPLNIRGMEDIIISENIPEKSPVCENVQPTVLVADISQKGNEKKDNEDELAALMLASSTIRGPSSSLEKKRKSKQQRDTDANLALLSPEKGSAMEERDSSFTQAFFQKIRERLDSCKTERSNLWEDFFSNLNLLGLVKSNETEGKTNEEREDILGHLLEILAPHPDLVQEFSIFLNSKQALQYGCLASHLSAVQMRDFIHKLEVYFAKQPSHMQKIVTLLSGLTNKQKITLEEIKEEVVPLLKGNSILLNKLLQLLPNERPPESLMTDFEELEFWDDIEQVGDEEPVEVIRLPDRETEDRFGGEGCACCCHTSLSPDAPQVEKDACRNSHCNRCGLKFVNGRVVLQTAKGVRPARVVFDSPADFQRLVVKDAAVPPPRLSKGRTRKKSKANDNKDESTSPPPKVRLLQGTESEEEVGAVKLTEVTTSPRAQPRSLGKGSRTPASKGKDSKTSSIAHKSVTVENSHVVDTIVLQKLDTCCGVDFSGKDGKASLSNNGSDMFSSEQQTVEIVKNDDMHCCEKNVDKLTSRGSQDGEGQQCTGSSTETGSTSTEEIPWTREEDRIILQTFQVDGGKSNTLVKIRQKLPGRSVAEIASRFHKLMSLFRKMTGPSTAACESEDIDLDKKV